jgi:mannitol-1-/sugar-/sorbitol-6-phosphatase
MVSLERVYDKVIFDMDGTLVDSRTAVERAWRKWAQKHGVSAGKILAVAHGRRTQEVLELFAPEGMDIEREARELEGEEGEEARDIVAVPGAVELLRWIPAGDWAVVTSASRQLASRRLLAAGLPLPDVLVSAEDVSTGKPHPQGYLLASDRMRARAADCLVFEDAHAGILAAKGAGCDVVAITAAHPQAVEADCPKVVNFHCISFSLRSTMQPRRWQPDRGSNRD